MDLPPLKNGECASSAKTACCAGLSQKVVASASAHTQPAQACAWKCHATEDDPKNRCHKAKAATSSVLLACHETIVALELRVYVRPVGGQAGVTNSSGDHQTVVHLLVQPLSREPLVRATGSSKLGACGLAQLLEHLVEAQPITYSDQARRHGSR